jgi:hypothetical protein
MVHKGTISRRNAMGHYRKSMKGRGILRFFYCGRKFIEIGHGSGEFSGSTLFVLA